MTFLGRNRLQVPSVANIFIASSSENSLLENSLFLAVFPQIPSETCSKLMEKWVQFKLTEFKGFWRVNPDTANDSFKMPDNHNFNILFSVLPGILQHPSQKVESASGNVAEQVIFLLKAISLKYCNIIVGWPKDHPQYSQLSQFATSAFVSFSRASYFFAIPLKNCVEATGANVNVFSPSLEYTVSRLLELKSHVALTAHSSK
jgi:hypothetical protein